MKKILFNLLVILGLYKPYVGFAKSVIETTPAGEISMAGECGECGGTQTIGGGRNSGK